ncbi:MAG: tRNA (adenosine(37)-N6)-threonylcarbamoyltransferase complex transferase subunit TsaD [Phycisphaerales bacterium]
MRVLGVESSCDETAFALVEDGRRVIASAVASQHDLHEEFGGVVPEIASRAHVERLIPTLRTALREAGRNLSEVDAIAVGHTPGLIGALLVGVSCAKALSWALGVPLVGVDHVRAHLYAGLLDTDLDESARFPALGFVGSGGHTALYEMASPTSTTRLGATIDDAIGEAYDKVGAMLELGHPGGPVVDRLAQTGDERAHDFPVSTLGKDSLDFSFSGLKTAVLYAIRGQPTKGPDGKPLFARDASDLSSAGVADLCASFQRAAVRAVVKKVERAHERLPAARTLFVGGGVAANSALRTALGAWGERSGVRVVLPELRFCVDNGAMIAGLGSRMLEAGVRDDLSLCAVPSGGAPS